MTAKVFLNTQSRMVNVMFLSCTSQIILKYVVEDSSECLLGIW